MNIAIGQTYRTRDGGYALVEAEHKDEPVYQFSGKCFDKNGNYERLAYWMSNGSYSSSHQTEFDITSAISSGEQFCDSTNAPVETVSQCMISFWSGSDLLAHVPLPAGDAPIDKAKAIVINRMGVSDDPDVQRVRALIDTNKCNIRLHNGEHSVLVVFRERSVRRHENFVTPRPLMDVGGVAPVGVDLVRADEFVAPLSAEQLDAVRAVAGHYAVASEAFVYETVHGHVIHLGRAEQKDAVVRTQRDEVEFYLGLVKNLRWVEVADDSVEIGIAGPVMGPDYFLIEEDDAAPRP